MRRLMTVGISGVAAMALSAGVVLAAAPHAGGTYTGHGLDYLNNGPHFETASSLSQPVRLTVSANGRKVARFSGRYVWYCGAGHSNLTATSLAIHNGAFTATGHTVTKYSDNYFSLSGHFTDGGRRAAVIYQADFVTKGKHVSKPYSFAFKSAGVNCQTQVRATLTLR